MSAFLKHHLLVKKIGFTFFLILIFLLGRQIPLPGVDVNAYLGSENSFIRTTSSLTGGNLSQIGLFSLGLGPWMSAMILMRLLTLGRDSQQLSPKALSIRQNSLMLVVAIIQALGICISLKYKSGQPLNFAMVIVPAIVLIGGSFIIAWLGNINSMHGLGGPAILVVVSMMVTQFQHIPLMVDLFNNGYALAIIVLMGWSFISMFFIVFLEHSEYRVPVMRISIHNRLVDKAYIPIKVNASGGMPLMYVYTFLMLPQYFIMLFAYFYPNNHQLQAWSLIFNTYNIWGICIFSILLFVLAIAFSLINIDPTKLAEDMRNAGDYIPNIEPGKETQLYLRHLGRFFGVFSGFFLVIMCVLPLLLTLGNTRLQSIAQLTGIVMMMTGILLSVIEEIKTARLRSRYKPLFSQDN